MTTTNQEPTMTTPTPPAWMLCDHRDIGLPGCPTCDGRLDPEARRLLLELAQFTSAAVMGAHAAEAECARLRETLNHLTAVAPKEPVGIGPWTRIGGPMPEPWPGCSVELHGGDRMLVVRVEPGHGAIEWLMDAHTRIDIPSTAVAALWDGRVCVWRRDA